MNNYEDPISDFIEASAEGLCTAYVVIATIERITGEQSFWITTMRNQTASASLGLLESASAAEKYRIARSFNNRYDEDDDEELLHSKHLILGGIMKTKKRHNKGYNYPTTALLKEFPEDTWASTIAERLGVGRAAI